MRKQIEKGVVTIKIDDPNEINLIVSVTEEVRALRKKNSTSTYLPLLTHAKLLVLLERLSEGLKRIVESNDVKDEIFKLYEQLGGNVRYMNQKNDSSSL